MKKQIEAKHTPGPWSRGQDYQDLEVGSRYRNVVGVVDGSSNGLFVAKVLVGSHETEANARLIAAAPDLLAALKLVPLRADNCRCHLVENGNCENCPPRWHRKMIRAAIAKAEGK